MNSFGLFGLFDLTGKTERLEEELLREKQKNAVLRIDLVSAKYEFNDLEKKMMIQIKDAQEKIISGSNKEIIEGWTVARPSGIDKIQITLEIV